MCGIFACLHASHPLEHYKKGNDSIKHRGPDFSVLTTHGPHVIGFHRLAINDLSEKGNQPLAHPDHPELRLICNGEIYNHTDLQKIYNFKVNSSSDCEIILHMYKRFGIERTLKELDGYFAFVLLDGDDAYVARDTIGVRSLYMGYKETEIYVASELKAIHPYSDRIEHFPPGHYWSSKNNENHAYDKINHNRIIIDEYSVVVKNTRDLLIEAVQKRVNNTERPIGCFLSGGLDSSIITALVCKLSSKPVHTFSIGMAGSVDLYYAQMVAEHLHTIHHEVIVTEQDMLNAIPDVIRQIETYDTTTVRASTPMYLLSKYIYENTDIRVILSGEGSDELSGSYAYFKKAPSSSDAYNEIMRLTLDLQYFDVLRCDKSTAGNGLEVRVPFLDKEFMSYYLHINPEYKWYQNYECEKYLLREAFLNYLPEEVLWRTKEAFSDGVSNQQRSWYTIIQEHVSKLDLPNNTYEINPPQLKETLWYRTIFEQFYPGRSHILPYYWLPKWCGNIKDPSARTLDIY